MSKVGTKGNRSVCGNIVIFIFLFVIGAFMALPLVFIISNSFKPINELFIFPPKLFPNEITFDNFKDLNALMGDSWITFPRYVFNTVIITIAGTLGNIIFGSMAAYMLSKFEFPGRNFLFQMVVISLLFTGGVTAIPSYIIITKMGMVNTYWSIILPACASSMGLFLMKQFMDQMIPNTLLEAARIDGAGEVRIFTKIAMPLVKPAWITMIIFSFQGMWSATGSSYIFDEKLKTLPTALSNVVTGGIARTGASAAISLIMILPPIAVFLISQSNVMQTMSTSGIK